MAPEEIQAMAKGLAQGQAVWYVLSACIGGAFAFLGAYGAEKAKNHATKQDIGEITKAVKAVEAGFNEKLADLQAHHQLRMVAAERRMQAHQEAFELWGYLYNAVELPHKRDLQPILDKCTDWYMKNCIFLTDTSRKAFNMARVAAQAHFDFRNDPQIPRTTFQENWEMLESIGNILLAEVNLPKMSDESIASIHSRVEHQSPA